MARESSSPRHGVGAMAARAIKALVTGAFLRRLKFRKNIGAQQVSNRTDVLSRSGNEAVSEPLPSEVGIGSVYWGQLPDGTQIAVKRLNNSNLRPDKQFALEAEKMGKMQHKNVLSLRGYCVEKCERIIVYDFVPNSSLLAHLHGAFAYDTHLNWNQRMVIARGCAEGLAYLHENGMVHGNIKSSNILLSSTYEPLYTDYGVASLMKRPVIKAKASLGYTAPECSNGEEATKQSDVFSFGILLLELISGRRPMEKVEFSLRQHIVEWAEPIILDSRLEQLVDPNLGRDFATDELKRIVFVATICAQTKAENRPQMSRIVELLQGIGR